MKIGKYILKTLPSDSHDIKLGLPYNECIIYSVPYYSDEFPYESIGWSSIKFKSCKHLRPNTGIRYEIIGLYWKLLIIKKLN